MEPTEVLQWDLLGSKPILPRVRGGWWLGRAMSIDVCCVRGPFFHGLTFYVGADIVGAFGENCSHTQTHSSISMSSLKHVERTNDAAHNVASAVCVCVCASCCTSILCCFHFSDIVCFVFQTFRGVVTETIPFASLMCRYSKKLFMLHATTHALSFLPLSCLFRVVVSMKY